MENSVGMKPIHLPHCASLPAWRRKGGSGYRCVGIDCYSVSLSSLHDQIYFLKGAWKKLLGGAWKSAAQQTWSCCDRRWGFEVSCGERGFCETQATRCYALRPFSPPAVVSSNHSVASHRAAGQTKAAPWSAALALWLLNDVWPPS